MRRVRRLKKIFTQGIKVIKYVYYLIYCKLFPNKVSKYKNIWLISERGLDARDNGYFFYKYLIENHKEIDVRYIISTSSPDFNKIKKLGKYIIYGSKEHYIAVLTSKVLISAHLMGFSPDMGLFIRLQRYKLLKLNGKIIWLQHGVIMSKLPDYITKNNIYLFVTSTKQEQNFIVKTYDFSYDVVKCTGLARFDNLKKIKSNQILFMPTFRINLLNMNDKEFINSSYYKNINKLLNNRKLEKILLDNNLDFVFYLHYEFQKYSHLFHSDSSKIKIATMSDYDVQELLINSCLLITDYSSVSFDFAYMEKPILYYQFDYNEYRKYHYKEGYFSYKKDGFGPICCCEGDLIRKIDENIKNDFQLDKKIINKINNYFPKRDKNNSKRIYNEIIKISINYEKN